MKVLVDNLTNKIRGTFEEPLDFSVSGHYVIDIPSTITVEPSTQVVGDLVTSKINAFRALHPTLGYSFYDEFLDTSKVDAASSTGVVVGPNKRTAILPGGTLYTTVFTPAIGVGKVFLHYTGAYMHRDVGAAPYPPASRMLYNYQTGAGGFVNFSTADLTVNIVNGSTLAYSSTPTPDAEYVVGTPATFRLQFQNVSPVPIHMADWLLLYG